MPTTPSVRSSPPNVSHALSIASSAESSRLYTSAVESDGFAGSAGAGEEESVGAAVRRQMHERRATRRARDGLLGRRLALGERAREARGLEHRVHLRSLGERAGELRDVVPPKLGVAHDARLALSARARGAARGELDEDADRGRDAERVALDEVGALAVGERGEGQREELLVGDEDDALLEVRGDGRDEQRVKAEQQLGEGSRARRAP